MVSEMLAAGLEVVLADQGLSLSKDVTNCIKITGTHVSLSDVVRAAARNHAMVDNSGEEAGDDSYAVQLPGKDQELLDRDALTHRLSELNGLQDHN